MAGSVRSHFHIRQPLQGWTRCPTDPDVSAPLPHLTLSMLKGHLRATYNMTPEEYRVRWGLPPDYPMTAPNYAKQRSEMAKKFGLGRKAGKVKPKGRGKGAAKK